MRYSIICTPSPALLRRPYVVGHGVMISTSEKPFLRIAFSITRSSGIGRATVSRATNDAPAPFASWTMSKLGSIEPNGAVDARSPVGVAGDTCPPVMP